MKIDLNAARNMLGPLDGEVRARVIAAIENPCEKTWDDAHSIILNPDVGFGLTLWQAVLAVNPSFGEAQAPVSRWVDDNSELGGHSERVSGWRRVPSADMIMQAINYATR